MVKSIWLEFKARLVFSLTLLSAYGLFLPVEHGLGLYIHFIACVVALLLVGYSVLFRLPNTKRKLFRNFGALYFTLLLFFLLNIAQFDWLVEKISAQSFNGMETRIDAMYFVIGNMVSGTGNIYPVSQFAKVIVVLQSLVGFTLTAIVLNRIIENKLIRRG